MVDHNGNGNGNGNAKWTIMMYIAADSTLANFAVQSLKQLQAAATHDIVVAAQFGSDGERDIPRLIFDGTDTNGPLDANIQDEIACDTDMANPTSLSDFIDWVYQQQQCSGTQYWGLVLWGHGPELLFDDYVEPTTHKSRKSFLTPSALAKAVQHTKFVGDTRRFDIIAIDACNMSIVEVAHELCPYAEFLVASQEEVPDFSFPYDSLLPAFSNLKRGCEEDEIANLCRELPKLYIEAYTDYILTQQAATPSITLTSIRLKNVPQVTKLLKTLAKVLLQSVPDPGKREAIIAARANCKDFVAGLYADLCDFCEQLRGQYSAKDITDPDLTAVCQEICAVIRARGTQACVIANEAPRNWHCHGLSIYFPYFTDVDQASFSTPSAPLAKGGIDLLQKGGIDLLQKGGIDLLQKGLDALNQLRRQRIEETEDYYYDRLKLFSETGWGEFIRHGWSRCLAEDAAENATVFPRQNRLDLLDQRYSAEQCALNLLSLCKKLEGPDEGGDDCRGRSAEQRKDPSGSSKRPFHQKVNGHAKPSRTQN